MDYTALIEEWEDHLPTEQLSGGLRATAAAALCQTSAPDPRQDGLSWGPWRYDAQRLTLEYGQERYEIDLEECDTAAEILDWICQVSQKSWCSPEDTGHLVDAFIALLDPQSHVCRSKSGRTVKAKTVLRTKMAA
jgi:hypothetical protein